MLLVVSISCTQDNDQYINNDSQNKEMQFNVSLPDVATRSTSLINSREELDGMSVGLYAFRTDFEAPYSKELIADNIRLTYNETTSTWEYVDLAEPLRWNFKHMFDKFSFYVYYPYDENAAKVNFDMDNASFSIDYDAVADADVDVMIAELEDIVCPRGGVITIGLKHILSAISFNTDYTKPIEEVKFCSESTYTTMPKSGTASLSNGVVEWSNIQNYDTTYSDLLGNTPGNYVLIIPQTTQNKGDLYFEMSYNVGVTPVDTAAKIPALMEFTAGPISTCPSQGS